jgi:hypothetical protein
MPGLAERLLRRPLEPRPVPHRLVYEAGVIGVLEHRPDPLDFVAQRHRAPRLGHGHAQPLEIVGRQVANQAGQPERAADPLAGGVIVRKRPRGDLPGVKQVSLMREEAVQQVAHGQAVALDPGRAAGLQVVALVEVLRQGPVRV